MTARYDDGTRESPKWCQEPDGHGGDHRRYLTTLLAGRSSIAVTLERDEHGPQRPVLSIGNGQTVEVPMTWELVDQLAAALDDARTRYAA